MAKSTFNDRNHKKVKQMIITKEVYNQFPVKHLFNNWKLEWFTTRLANKVEDYLEISDKIDSN